MVFMRLFSEHGTHHIFFVPHHLVGRKKKAVPLYRSSPLLTLWPIWHCSFVMVLQHKLNDRSCDHFKDRCDLILLLTTLENHQNCTKVKMWVFRNCMNFNSFKSYFMQQSGAQRQSRALILHVLLWCTKLHKVFIPSRHNGVPLRVPYVCLDIETFFFPHSVHILLWL